MRRPRTREEPHASHCFGRGLPTVSVAIDHGFSVSLSLWFPVFIFFISHILTKRLEAHLKRAQKEGMGKSRRAHFLDLPLLRLQSQMRMCSSKKREVCATRVHAWQDRLETSPFYSFCVSGSLLCFIAVYCDPKVHQYDRRKFWS